MDKPNYMELCQEYYNSNLSMTKFCAQRNLSFQTFKDQYYKVAPSRNIIFDHKARKERIKQEGYTGANPKVNFLELCHEYYNSNLTMGKFCAEKGISIHSFKDYYYKIAPSKNIIFDADARRQRIHNSSFTNSSTSTTSRTPKITATDIMEKWIKVNVVTKEDLKQNPFDATYREMVLEIIEVFRKYGI